MSPEIAVEAWSTAALLETVLAVLIRENAADVRGLIQALLRP